MTSKAEKDMGGAVALLADFFGGDIPEVRRAANMVREKMGIKEEAPQDQDSGVIDVPGYPLDDEGKGPDPLLIAVYFEDGSYSGRAYVDSGQAVMYSSRHPGSFLKPVRASELAKGL